MYIGRGTPDMRDDLLDFLNYAFGFNGNDKDLLKMLPKMYNKEYDPCGHNYVITENGKMRASVGVYPRTLHVLDETLQTYGGGNVAVHPYHRSKGYMKELMHQAIQDMISAGADMSELGGKRQRYQYFGYDIGGAKAVFTFDTTSMRHCFGKSPLKNIQFEPVIDKNSPWLELICHLHSLKPLHMERPDKQFFDIACSWQNQLYAIHEGDQFIGYYIGALGELTLANTEDFIDVLRCYVAQNKYVTLRLPLHETKMIEFSHRICSAFSMEVDEHYSIFHFKKVVYAFMKLKASVIPLMDGSLTVQVNGIAGRECFQITVKNGILHVTDTSEEPQIVLEHKEAEMFFFTLISPTRTMYPLANTWFPLPIQVDRADQV